MENTNHKALKTVMVVLSLLAVINCFVMDFFSIMIGLRVNNKNYSNSAIDLLLSVGDAPIIKTIAVVSLVLALCIAILSFFIQNGVSIFWGAAAISFVQFVICIVITYFVPLIEFLKLFPTKEAMQILKQIPLDEIININIGFPALIAFFTLSFQNMNIYIGALGIILDNKQENTKQVSNI